MNRLQVMQIFTRVVELKGFRKTAEALSLSPSTVTLAIHDLEKYLGVQLLQRTTRRMEPTAQGAAYYEHCRHILTQVAEMDASFRKVAGPPRGRLRARIPVAFGRLVVLPALQEFQRRCPEVELSLNLHDGPMNLVREGLDCAMCVGEPEDSRFVARRIATLRHVACASPAYVSRHGEPHTIEELVRHHAVGYASSPHARPKPWELVCEESSVTVSINGTLVMHDSDAHVTCGVLGLGLILAPAMIVQPYLNSGRLRRVLTQWEGKPESLCVLHTQSRLLSPAARAFVDWLSEIFGNHIARHGANAGCPLQHAAF